MAHPRYPGLRPAPAGRNPAFGLSVFMHTHAQARGRVLKALLRIRHNVFNMGFVSVRGGQHKL